MPKARRKRRTSTNEEENNLSKQRLLEIKYYCWVCDANRKLDLTKFLLKNEFHLMFTSKVEGYLTDHSVRIDSKETVAAFHVKCKHCRTVLRVDIPSVGRQE